MGRKDSAAKRLMRDPRYFADAFNYKMFNGESVVDPDKLTELDTASDVSLNPKAGGKFRSRRFKTSYRDIVKEWIAKEGDEATYVILGLENQAAIDRTMPVRSGLYDFINYSDQVDGIRRSNRLGAESDEKNEADDSALEPAMRGGEYLSGFRKEDHIKPVVTLIMYLGSDPWDGPRTLTDMFLPDTDERVLAAISDYRLNLIVPARDAKEHFIFAERECAEFVSDVTNTNMPIEENEEGLYDMCKAFDDIRLEGKEEGRAEGKAEGRAEGREEGLIQSIRALGASMNWSPQQAMDALTIPKDEQKKYLKML